MKSDYFVKRQIRNRYYLTYYDVNSVRILKLGLGYRIFNRVFP
jgi:hypothetical protein